MSAVRPAAIVASIAFRKPRGAGCASARLRISSGDIAAFASAISPRFVASIFLRMSLIAPSRIRDRDELDEPGLGLALVDRGGGKRDTFLQRLRLAGDEESRAGIKE